MTERTPAGVFLSHSSKDKPFVTRLAIDLLNRGIPVWFDKWEMDTGDSLLMSIADGISDSTRLILVLSKSSIGSSWVKREITIGIAKEERAGGTFLLPVKIDESEVPLVIADRIFADFQEPSRYYEALDRLSASLRKSGAADLVPAPENELIAIEVRNGFNLVTAGLKSRLTKILPRMPAGFAVKEEQLVFGEEAEWIRLKAQCQQLLFQEGAATGAAFNRKKHNDLEELNHDFGRYDRVAQEGLIEILNGLRGLRYDAESIAEACFWFVKEVRSRVLTRVRHVAGECELPVTPEFEWLWALEIYGTYDDQSSRKFYEIEEPLYCDVWVPGEDRVYKVDLDKRTSEARDIFTYGQLTRLRLTASLLPWTLVKYVVPSMVYDHLIDKHFSAATIAPFNWDLDRYNIGLA